MIKIRHGEERGHFDHGWLKTFHTFSFSDYFDPNHMGFRTLRVINEDIVQPGKGFPMHSHRDMEILTYILEGELEHKDSMGNSSVIRVGDVQRMSAGTGVTHSERNPSSKNGVHLLQIWILPNHHGLKPGYEQKSFKLEEKKNRLHLIASENEEDNVVSLHQDIRIFDCSLDRGKSVTYSVSTNRGVWIQAVSGTVSFDEYLLDAGDGAAISKEHKLVLSSHDRAEFLLFDSV